DQRGTRPGQAREGAHFRYGKPADPAARSDDRRIPPLILAISLMLGRFSGGARAVYRQPWRRKTAPKTPDQKVEIPTLPPPAGVTELVLLVGRRAIGFGSMPGKWPPALPPFCPADRVP